MPLGVSLDRLGDEVASSSASYLLRFGSGLGVSWTARSGDEGCVRRVWTLGETNPENDDGGNERGEEGGLDCDMVTSARSDGDWV